MALAALLLAVLAHSSGSLVQAALTQPPSVSANPGQTVQITCSGSSNNYGWFQQKVPGTAPVTVIYWNDKRPSGIPSRFSGFKSDSTGTLTITGVQAEDEAVYYCGGYDSSYGIFGAGTMLTVLGQPKVSPTVHLFPPSEEEISSQSKATLVCLLGDFYPSAVQVAWTADGRTLTSGVETSQPQRQSNNQYMASSYLTLSASDWKSHETYTCKVTHEAGNVVKSLKRSEC
ncbi:immunoglobulin lambda-like polypeptide 1 isoform X42 [Tyto alba]|uniref:immunoglobulin lambda-like polypeptide 1 isoform X42 n=1 Tax=Tyto alba TaxID=56313 RepID=UPI001C6837E4|nr:immunoglobulin lambda-like polypeptide 1 isoform X42 [Tyto alba]